MVSALALWWYHGGSDEINAVKLGASSLGKEFMRERRMHEYQFFPATNPKIHVGFSITYSSMLSLTLCSTLADGLLRLIDYAKMEHFLVCCQRCSYSHADSAYRLFAGAYFDITIKNTTSLLLALHNAPYQESSTPSSVLESPMRQVHGHRKHYSFHPIPADKAAPPISLLAEVDDEEYILLPNCSSLVTISSKGLNARTEHHVRIVAPMTDDHGLGIVELEGLWLSKGGKLVKVPGSLLGEDYVNEDSLNAENDQVGAKHQTGLDDIGEDGTSKSGRQTAGIVAEDDYSASVDQDRRKLLEIITDSPGSLSGTQRSGRTGGSDGLLSGVMGWEYLLGEMFRADHVGIGVEGMCLVPDCIGGTGEPAGMGDVFFRR